MTDQIILSQSEYEKLMEAVRDCRAKIIELTALRDDLIYHVCPALQAKYDEKIGSVERELLAAQMYLKEKQRIIELLQAQINRQEKPSLEDAEAEAKEEFREYREDLKRKAEEARKFREYWENEAQWSKHEREQEENRNRQKREQGQSSDVSMEVSASKDAARDPHVESPEKDGKSASDASSGMPGGEASSGRSEDDEPEDPIHELKRLYRQIVKRLHPDVNPNPTQRDIELLNKANAAYKAGDLEALRKIWEEIAGADIPEEVFEDTEEGRRKLRELLAKLRRRCKALEEEIRRIKSAFPYTMKPLLDDDEAVERKREELLNLLQEVRKLFAELDAYIERLREKLAEGAKT